MILVHVGAEAGTFTRCMGAYPGVGAWPGYYSMHMHVVVASCWLYMEALIDFLTSYIIESVDSISRDGPNMPCM